MDNGLTEKTQLIQTEPLTKVESGARIVERRPDTTVELRVTEAKKRLLDPREISRQHDPDGRIQAFLQSAEARQNLAERAAKIAEHAQALQQAQTDRDILVVQEVNSKKKLVARKNQLGYKLRSILGIGDRETEHLQTEADDFSERRAQNAGVLTELDRASRKREAAKGEQVSPPKEIIEAYYKKMLELPMTVEEKREYLKPEFLASLTEAEYAALWRRLSPHRLTHVTRQGVKEGSFQEWKSGKLFAGADAMLSDGKMLRPLLNGAEGLRLDDEISVKRYLERKGIFSAANRDEAVRELDRHLNSEDFIQSMYPDRSAVHFANDIVLSEYYGSEEYNDVFVVYPADFLASQYDFSVFGKRDRNLLGRSRGDLGSDVLVYPDDIHNPGFSVDAGVVFLPKDTLVDPETGSKYLTEVKVVDGVSGRYPIEDQSLIDVYVKLGLDYSTGTGRFAGLLEEMKTAYPQTRDAIKIDFTEGVADEIMELGFSIDVAHSLAHDLLIDLVARVMTEKGLEGNIRKHCAQWKRPKDGIIAQEYWERRFQSEPDKRPRHVYYYFEGHPTEAVEAFLRKMGIGRETAQPEDPMLGFEDRHIENINTDPRARKGYDELLAMANKIIEEEFANR